MRKFREHQYIEGYAKYVKSKRVEWDEGKNVEQMWAQMSEQWLTA